MSQNESILAGWANRALKAEKELERLKAIITTASRMIELGNPISALDILKGKQS